MTCDFTSLSAVFQSYQDVRRVIIKCYLQWKPYTVELQWLEHQWLVSHGCFELVLEILGTNIHSCRSGII